MRNCNIMKKVFLFVYTFPFLFQNFFLSKKTNLYGESTPKIITMRIYVQIFHHSFLAFYRRKKQNEEKNRKTGQNYSQHVKYLHKSNLGKMLKVTHLILRFSLFMGSFESNKNIHLVAKICAYY